MKLNIESDGSAALRGAVVISPYPPELTAADIAEIVRRVNAHDDLVAAVRDLPESVYAHLESIGCDGNAIALRAALANANGGAK